MLLPHTFQKGKGFTLVELLIVFTIMAILSTAGFAAYVTYSKQQIITSAAQDIKDTLSSARSLTLSQSNNAASCYNGQCSCNAGQAFGGYSVLFCSTSCTGGLCPTCLSDTTADHTELDVICAGRVVGTITSKKLPSQVTFSSSSTSRSFTFQPLTGLVTGAGTISITGLGQTQSLTVSQVGVVNAGGGVCGDNGSPGGVCSTSCLNGYYFQNGFCGSGKSCCRPSVSVTPTPTP